MNLRIFFGIITLVGITWSGVKADDEQDLSGYFPMKVGTKWTYVVVGQEEKFIFVASREEKLEKITLVRFEGRVKNEPQATEHLTIAKGGLYRYKFNEKQIQPPLCIWKLPSKKGEKWKEEIKVDDKKATVNFRSDVETVKVPAGEYKDAEVVHSEVVENGVTVKTSIWFVPKVGIVKQVHDFGKDDQGKEAKIVLELEKVETPEVKK